MGHLSHCGSAILSLDLVDIALQRITKVKKGLRKISISAKPAPCHICKLQQEAGKRYILALTQGLNEKQDAWQALEKSEHLLCIAHISALISLLSPQQADRVRMLAQKKITALQKELEEAVRKSDYRFLHEASGSERDAWLRAMQLLNQPHNHI